MKSVFRLRPSALRKCDHWGPKSEGDENVLIYQSSTKSSIIYRHQKSLFINNLLINHIINHQNAQIINHQ
jgi:hypothetical protein